MDAHAPAHEAHADHGHPNGWRRFVYSTNHKDIGTMYLVFAIMAPVGYPRPINSSSGCAPIGSIVVPAGEVERADGIVLRPNREQPRRSPATAEHVRRVADRRRLRRLQILPDPAAALEPRRGQRVRSRRFRRRRHDDRLLDAEVGQLLEQPRQARRADRRRGASRRASSPSGAKLHLVRRRSRAAPSARRQSRPRGGRVRRRSGRTLPRGARRPPRWSDARSDRAGAPPPTSAKTRSRWASRSCTVDQQLAKSGLSEILRQQLRVAPADLAGQRLLQLRRAADADPTSRASSDRSPPTPTAATGRCATRSGPRCRRVAAAPDGGRRPRSRRPRRGRAPPDAAATSAARPARTPTPRRAGTRRQARRAADADHLQDEVDRKDDQPDAPSPRAAPRRSPAPRATAHAPSRRTPRHG